MCKCVNFFKNVLRLLTLNSGYQGPLTEIIIEYPIPGVREGRFHNTITAEKLHSMIFEACNGKGMINQFPHAEAEGPEE